MEKRYSILIMASRDARVRRFGFSRRSACAALSCAALAIALAGWFVGDYIWLKVESGSLRRLQLKAKSQREQFSRLQDQTQNIQTLLADWRGLREKVDATVPLQQRLATRNRFAVTELQQSLNSLQTELQQLVASIPTDWPATGAVTSGVGDRISPFTGKIEFHSGIDIPKPTGTPVLAPGNGTVQATGEMNGNGRTVILDHGQGITTQYLHLSKIDVAQGQQVRKGQQIAEVGSTGHSTSPHLHYEVRINGAPIDPRKSLLK